MIIINFDPVLIDFGFYKICFFGTWAIVSLIFFTAMLWTDLKQNPVTNFATLVEILLELIIVAIVGAKLFFFLEQLVTRSQIDLCNLLNGFSLLGSLLILPIYAYLRLPNFKINFFDFADLISFRAPILQILFRISCFMVGCCVGQVCSEDSWLCVLYQNPASMAPLDTPLFGTQIISMLLSALVFVFLVIIKNGLSFKGRIFAFYLILEGLARLVIDHMRLDRAVLIETSKISISVNQAFALAISISGLIILFYSYSQANKLKTKD